VVLVPAPSVTIQQGVVWLPEQAIVRADTDGTLLALHAQRGQQVRAGQLIATLENLELVGERETAAARRAQLDVEYYQALLKDPLQAQRVAAERDGVAARLARLDERIAALEVRAKVDGTLVLPRERESEGTFFAQGSEIGYVLTGEPVLVKVALTEPQAALVRQRHAVTHDPHAAAMVSVRLAHAPDEELEGRIERETPGVTRELPSAVLGSSAGGPIATDPADPKGRQTLQPVSVIDVRVARRTADHMGMRAWVRFEHADEPLATQALRWLRQLFLRSLGAHS
jgi:putative peptide zinc metalloprotease protein